MNDFKKRLPTTLLMLAFIYIVIQFLQNIYFSAILFIIISIASFEIFKLASPITSSFPLILFNGAIVGIYFTFHYFNFELIILFPLFSFGLFFLFQIKKKDQLISFIKDFGLHFLIIFYLYFPLYYIFEIKKFWGSSTLFFLISVIALGDSGAYFVGSTIGKRKIYPIASPKKSLEGLMAAVITAGISGYFLSYLFSLPLQKWQAVFISSIIGIFSQLSDPIESLFKRAADVKDSGKVLPGHGGILDRLDSYIFCAPLFTILIKIFSK